MSLLTYNFQSHFLAGSTEVSIILPDKPFRQTPKEFFGSGKRYKVLWLLHGTFGDHTDWVRKTNIELYATENDLVVVMPSALNSNYSNWDVSMMGYSMFDFLSEELMPLVYGWLPVSDKRCDNFIAGLSMGGRGAIKYAVNHPELFAAAAILSAAPLDFANLRPGAENMLVDTESPRMRNTLLNAGGLEAFRNSNENVWAIIDQLADSGTLPRLLFAFGKDDGLYKSMLDFKAHAEQIKLDVEWLELDGYKHEWRFWDIAIQHALEFFGITGQHSR